MSYKTSIIYAFEDNSGLGINEVPRESILFLMDSGKFYNLNSLTGLDSTSTVLDAINNGNIIDITNELNDSSIDDLKDIDTSTNPPSDGDILGWDPTASGGNGAWVPKTLTTDDITEGTNLYYTDTRADARVQAAIEDSSTSSDKLWSASKINSVITTGVAYKSHWDANSNNPTLADGTGDTGAYYIVSIAGTQDLGSGTQTFDIGDFVMYTENNIWEKIINSNKVQSVNGEVGVIELELNNISDIDLSNETIGDYITWDGTQWVNEKFGDNLGIGDLSDVDMTTPPSNNQILVWNGTYWAPGDENPNTVISEDDTTTGEHRINSMVHITKTDYDALGTKDPNKLYIIVG